jgi:hypothetical protein
MSIQGAFRQSRLIGKDRETWSSSDAVPCILYPLEVFRQRGLKLEPLRLEGSSDLGKRLESFSSQLNTWFCLALALGSTCGSTLFTAKVPNDVCRSKNIKKKLLANKLSNDVIENKKEERVILSKLTFHIRVREGLFAALRSIVASD